MALVLHRVIEAAYPSTIHCAHEVRKFASTLAFLMLHSMKRVREVCQWRSVLSFFLRGTSHTSVQVAPCVAMGLPSLSVDLPVVPDF